MTKKITKLMLNGQEYEIREYVEPRWQPGGNTIAYYPLTSQTQGADMKGFGVAYDLTSTGTITYGNVGDVDCCYLNGQMSTSISNVTSAGGLTISYWFKYKGAPQHDNGQMAALNNGTINSGWLGGVLCNGRPAAAGNIAATAVNMDVYGAYDMNEWTYVCMTENSSTVSLYINGVLVDSGTPDSSSYSGINIGYTGRTLNGYMSEVIYESKEWTPQEISDYYDLTKSLYGIS